MGYDHDGSRVRNELAAQFYDYGKGPGEIAIDVDFSRSTCY